MNTVWRYQIYPAADFTVMMPAGAQIVHVDVQHDTPYMWALVDTEEERVAFEFMTVITGREAPSSDIATYIGSWKSKDGAFIWHLFLREPLASVPADVIRLAVVRAEE